DVDVPGLQVRAHRTLASSTLVDRDGGVVGDLQERHDALALAVGATNVGTQTSHRGPVVAEPTRVLRQHRVVADAVEDVLQIVAHGGQEAGRQLRPHRARVEQGGGGGHEVERGQQL